jgi:Tol biopolymer transport system component/tRNA A-37 threonylcarbamoyl transferase component Bud32
MIGTTLGHYRVLEKLGAGGMGEVYAAEDTTLGRRVALKRLPAEMAADADRLHRFQREARAVAALNHPNIVTIYTVEETDGVQFLTMELVEGQTLAEAIPQGGLPLEALLKLAVPLVEAVAFAHQHGIVHRDLKPANIMLTGDGRLKVLDFGLAKLKPELAAAGTDATTRLATQSLTQGQAVIGTPWYMSPEQAAGRAVDHRSDIFSLGVVLYEMACGQRPFQGDTALSVISSIIKDTPAPVSAVNRGTAPALDRIVTRALAKDPAERYQHATEMRDELQQVQAQTVSVRIVSNLVRAVARSRWTWRLALAAGLMAVAAGSAWYLWAGRDSAGARAPAAPLRFQTTRLSAHAGVEQFPSLLPDGKWVLYSGQETGNRDIYLLSTSGQKPINLTADSPADDDEPAASPDGERIAFRSSREGGGIFVMGRTGEGVRRVTPVGVSAAFNPAWSPKGDEIAYTTENVQLTPLNWERKSELWVVNVNTGEQRRIEVDDAVQASWSPHGHRIAYVSRRQKADAGDRSGASTSRVMDVYTVPAGDGESVAATDDRATDWSPVWSPDGRYLYFVSERGGSMNLWRVAIDEVSGRRLGEPEPIITPAPFLAHPSVSADGRRIAYTAVVQTSNVQRLTLDPAAAAVKGEPAWVTSGSRLWANPDPSPDGEWVVFYSRDQPEGDIYVSRPDGTGLRQLTSDPAIDRVPRWSPDKTWVAFFSNRSGALAVWKIRAADGSGLQQVTETGGVVAWAPDSARMATTEIAPFAGFPLVVDAGRPWKEQKPERLPRPDRALHPFVPNAWSPDGSKLAGMIGFSDRGGNGVVLYTFATGTYERLTDFGEWPVWLGDSRRLLFVNRGREFWTIDTRTKATRKVYSTIWDTLGPPQLTRDARAAFFTRRETQGDVYLLTFEE